MFPVTVFAGAVVFGVAMAGTIAADAFAGTLFFVAAGTAGLLTIWLVAFACAGCEIGAFVVAAAGASGAVVGGDFGAVLVFCNQNGSLLSFGAGLLGAAFFDGCSPDGLFSDAG